MNNSDREKAPSHDSREGGLLAWQMRGYPTFHLDRGNLLVHVVTVPLFWVGLLCVPAAILFDPWCGLGALGMFVALAAQGRGHKQEPNPPLPFRGPLDVLVRFAAEQLVTFPRFLLSGGWWRALREARR